MNHTMFFNRIRSTIYGGNLRQITVDNINVILEFWESKFPANVKTQLAYVLATVLAEVGKNMNPVRETFAKTDEEARHRLRHKRYSQSTPPYGHAYYGRGYVQLTWKSNYKRQEEKLGVPLVQFPDLVLATENAVQILVDGMMAGDFNGHGHGLAYYVNENKTDFFEARRTVNILDRAREIAGYAEDFLDAIEYATETRPFAVLQTETDALSPDDKSLLHPSLEHLEFQHASLPFGEID